MKIAVWGINYAPELTGISPYNTELCEYFAGQGHSVRMVTAFPYYPNWRKRIEDRRKIFSRRKKNGVDVYRCWQYVPARPSAWKRMLHEASFAASSFLRQLFLDRPDVIIVVSPPLCLGPAAWLLSLIKRTPYHFHVQDIQPDAAICMGMLKRGKFASLLYAIEKFTYRRARSVSGITRGMLDLFGRKGLPPEKQYYLPNWSRESGPASETGPAASFRDHWHIPAEDFLVVYSGNLGKKQGLSIVVEAAEKLHLNGGDQNLTIVIAGDGGEKENIARALEGRQLPVRLLPLQPDPLFRSMLDQADLALVTQQPDSGALFFPSKILTLLTHGCPVVAVADDDSELRRAATEGKFGECVQPGQPRALAGAILALKNDPEKRKRLGAAGREWVSRFSRDEVLRRFEKFLDHTGEEPTLVAEVSPERKG